MASWAMFVATDEPGRDNIGLKLAKLDLGPTGSLHQTVQAIVTVLAVINPVVCGSIFLMLTRSLDSGKKRRAAINVTLFILAILVISALVGLKVLSAFGISLDVFRHRRRAGGLNLQVGSFLYGIEGDFEGSTFSSKTLPRNAHGSRSGLAIAGSAGSSVSEIGSSFGMHTRVIESRIAARPVRSAGWGFSGRLRAFQPSPGRRCLV